ncbi:MAG: type I DNA topoisomerase [bacterium]|nr:type I DNA topoisomerase [bacterium]
MHLVIVESPTKARKLSEYLDRREYTIEASVGHVRDLPKKKLGIDLENNFEPTYEVDIEKKKVVARLRELAEDAESIVLATDPDREGEAIAWHIQQLLTEKTAGKKTKKDAATLPEKIFVRSTFHEITKRAVLEAIAHPQKLNMQLVDAQQARRVVDRLVGYQVSPVLWKKVRRGLSAGRVQSVALRMIVEREREIEAFKPEEFWEVDVALNTAATAKVAKIFTNGKAVAVLPPSILLARVVEVAGSKYEPKQEADVTDVVVDLKAAVYSVKNVERKTRERSSLPPFTTSTLQQSAATRLGFTSKQTMSLAQNLYEEGLITYHRTDSVALSSDALAMAREYIGSEFGAPYLPEKPRFFAQKSKNAQEAHEAVRVTNVQLRADQIKTGKLTERHQRLYDLIWRRFLASQMSSAAYDQTSILITAQKDSALYGLRASGSILKFDGWMRLFTSQEDILLPSVEEGQSLHYADLNSAQKFTQPPPRYNDASLVRELEKKGIGRPSTYASIISVIVDRGYVERLDKRFTASSIGMTVSDFLQQNFPVFMEYDFTAEMEENLDRVARGEKEWRSVIKDFYGPLEKTIAEVTESALRVQVPVEKTGEKCPTCGDTEDGEIVIRSGRFGKFKSCSRFPDCKFTENIVEKLEGMLCPLCGIGDVIVKKSRWGKPFFGCARYPECDWASWSKPDPQLKLTTAQWDEMKANRAAKKAARAANAPAADKAKKTKAAPKKKKAAPKKKSSAAKK